MSEEYFSLQQASHTQLKIEGSKFIADAFPVEIEEEAKKHLAEIRKEYFDATHHCFAYALGESRSYVRFSDDGEPSGTAGIKILSAIQSEQLSDLLVVVTRYFGGTKLGVGGLGRAYFESAAECLARSSRITKAELQIVQVSFPFEATNPVMNLIHTAKVRINETLYTAHSTMLQLLVSPTNIHAIEKKLVDATRGRALIEMKGKKRVVLR